MWSKQLIKYVRGTKWNFYLQELWHNFQKVQFVPVGLLKIPAVL